MLIIDIPHTVYRIFIKCEDPNLESIVAVQYYPYIYYKPLSQSKDSIYIEQKGNSIVTKTKEDIKQIFPKNNIIALRKIINSCITGDNNYVVLHGSCITYKDQAIIILGNSCSGKSTLTAYLMANGYHYLTDDCVLLDAKSGKVFPYKRLLHLREGGYKLLQKEGVFYPACHLTIDNFDRWTVFPSENLNLVEYKVSYLLKLARSSHSSDFSFSGIQNYKEKIGFISQNIYSPSDLVRSVKYVSVIAQTTPLYFVKDAALSQAKYCIEQILKSEEEF
ncbi:MAG TPA: hypothetical protein IAD50_06465 [Candidatus Egerieisoma faecipullorum]|uniref:HPr kinase/phosphorylase n=1 Tax=Candidatus Egerieisoma faecipullorum TaxID=2840963 RepID=A0A9D1IAL2_9CLOT|nr:hypothetical protein [Candidatus Egerieisoma faecipullorum]